MGNIDHSKEIFKSERLEKVITNFEITRDSILEILKNKYDFQELIDIECFLDKLSEQTLEIILKDISKYKLFKR